MYNVNAKKILVIDDEPDIVDLVCYNLEREGFEVSSAPDGEEALRKIQNEHYGLIVLDLMLPGIQGFDLCRMLRKDPKTEDLPIIMITAKTEDDNRILGLEIGADDYITKPFNPRELAARVKAVLRRTLERPVDKGAYETPVRIGNLVVNRGTCEVYKKGVPLNLSAREFRLLLYFVDNRGKVFSRNQLLDAIWEGEAFVEPRTVDVHVRRLRMQVEDDPANPRYIKTKRGIGYYMDAEI